MVTQKYALFNPIHTKFKATNHHEIRQNNVYHDYFRCFLRLGLRKIRSVFYVNLVWLTLKSKEMSLMSLRHELISG